MLPALAMTNVCWLTFAPITSAAEEFYRVPPLRIAFLSMSYMIVYILMAVPASWLVDTKGFRLAVGTGALLTAGFGMMRGIFASDFTLVTWAQLGVAAGQPFLVNSITKMAARWFPVDERATAAGIATMAGYAGMVAALVLTPFLAARFGLQQTLLLHGYAAIACALIFLLFAREHPLTPPGPGDELVHQLNRTDLKGIIHNRDFLRLMVCLFVMMGIFNAVTTWIEDMLKPRGISSPQAGIIGGVMVAVGLIGAVILPVLSDRLRVRRPVLIGAVLVAIPGMAGLAFCSSYYLLLLSAALMGLALLGAGPVAFQYGAEIAYPLPEGTSYGILMTMGQISGIIFIFGMDAGRSIATGTMTLSLTLLLCLMFAVLLVSLGLRESSLIQGLRPAARSPRPEDIERARETVCHAGKRLLQSGFVSGTWGNLSRRVNEDYMVITPSGREYERLTPGDMVVVNLRDQSYEGNLRPSSELGLHAEIYRTRPEIGAVIHTHSPNASTVAAARREIPPILDDMAQIIGPSVRVADYALPSTKKLIRVTVRALAGRNAALLANHGAVCVGRDMEEAFVACEILEKSCRAFIEAEFLGGAVPINRIEARIMHEYYLRKYSRQKKT